MCSTHCACKTHTTLHTHMHVRTHTHTHMCMHTHTHTHTRTHTPRTHARTHARTHTPHARTHTHTHTHLDVAPDNLFAHSLLLAKAHLTPWQEETIAVKEVAVGPPRGVASGTDLDSLQHTTSSQLLNSTVRLKAEQKQKVGGGGDRQGYTCRTHKHIYI